MITNHRLKTLTMNDVTQLLPTAEPALAVTTLAMMRCPQAQISELEQVLETQVALRPAFHHILTVAGGKPFGHSPALIDALGP
jgi:hypothetical protein